MSEFEAERQKMLEVYGRDVQDLDSRFQPGSLGWHELWDRLHVQHAVWEDHLATHPSVILDANTFEIARQIGDLMAKLYLHVGSLMAAAEDSMDAK